MVATMIGRIEYGRVFVIGQGHRVVTLLGQNQLLANGQPVGAFIAGVSIVQLISGGQTIIRSVIKLIIEIIQNTV